MSEREVEVDEQTVEIIRDHDARLRDLQQRIERESAYSKRRELQRDFLAEVKRQEAVVSEVPGLEDHARRLAETREQFQRTYGLD